MIDVVDATYIIMQRVDGPELTEYLCRHPHRRLTAEIAGGSLVVVKGALAETDSVGAAIFGDIDAMSINNLLAAFDLDELGPLESASVDYEEFVNMVAGRRL